MMRPRRILALLYGVAIAQLGWIASHMPAVLATHYDAAGNPNGWMTRGTLIGFHFGMLTFMTLVFGVLPALFSRIPPKLINIPNREHWLSPERLSGTVSALQNWMAAMGCGVVLLLMAVAGLNHAANLESPARLSSAALVACVVGFLLYMAVAMIALVRRFPRPPAAQRT